MARSEARILVDIWTDDDFTAMAAGPQQRFMFLLSQPDLAHDGVIPLRPGRWARKTAGASIASVRAELAVLAAANFIVVDEETGEVLIRSFVRRDRVFKQPNVMRAAVDHVPLIESRTILDALLTETDRIRSENPHLTEQQSTTLAEMANELAKRVKGIPANPTGNPSLKDAPGTPGERGDVTAVSNDFPVPRSSISGSPDPAPRIPEAAPLAPLASPPARKSALDRGTRIPADFAVTEAMVAWAAHNAPDVNGRRETQAFLNYWRSKTGAGATKKKWDLTWQNWMLKAQTDAERNGNRGSPQAKRSTTDERVDAALALRDEFRDQTHGQLEIGA